MIYCFTVLEFLEVSDFTHIPAHGISHVNSEDYIYMRCFKENHLLFIMPDIQGLSDKIV